MSETIWNIARLNDVPWQVPESHILGNYSPRPYPHHYTHNDVHAHMWFLCSKEGVIARDGQRAKPSEEAKILRERGGEENLRETEKKEEKAGRL